MVRTRAGMCQTCPRARYTARGSAVLCLVDGKPVVSRCHAGGCPIGRHPDERGRVRWMGLLWRGVPWPVRLKLPAHIRLPGCGCVDSLKRLVEYARSIARDKRGAT